MQSAFDSLLVALFVALVPPEHEAPTSLLSDSFYQGFKQGYEDLRLSGDAARKDDGSACRYFANPVARSNCIARISRAASGAADSGLTFPDHTIWIAPGDPGMPFKLPPNSSR
jgi:hypothetical protein